MPKEFENVGLESQLFSWKNWDVIDVMDCFYYNCVLKVPMGDWKIGDEIASISILYSKSLIELYDGESVEPLATFPLKLSIG